MNRMHIDCYELPNGAMLTQCGHLLAPGEGASTEFDEPVCQDCMRNAGWDRDLCHCRAERSNR